LFSSAAGPPRAALTDTAKGPHRQKTGVGELITTSRVKGTSIIEVPRKKRGKHIKLLPAKKSPATKGEGTPGTTPPRIEENGEKKRSLGKTQGGGGKG